MKKVKIITHNGKFHADDIFAVATLFLYFGEENCELVRTRDEEIIKTGDIVLDVGGIYDVSLKRFDHHQREGAGKHVDTDIPYSSFGLIWKEYGLKVVGGDEELWQKINRKLVMPIDAIDNGIDITDNKIQNVHPVTLHTIIGSFMPSFDQSENSNFDSRFIEVVDFSKKFLVREIESIKNKSRGEKLVQSIYNKQTDKRVLVLEHYMPFGFLAEENPELIYVIYPSLENGYMARALDEEGYIFESRKLFPESWGGKRDAELEKETGVMGSVFCHRNRYICGAKTKSAILKLVEISLSL